MFNKELMLKSKKYNNVIDKRLKLFIFLTKINTLINLEFLLKLAPYLIISLDKMSAICLIRI